MKKLENVVEKIKSQLCISICRLIVLIKGKDRINCVPDEGEQTCVSQWSIKKTDGRNSVCCRKAISMYRSISPKKGEFLQSTYFSDFPFIVHASICGFNVVWIPDMNKRPMKNSYSCNSMTFYTKLQLTKIQAAITMDAGYE